MAGSAPVEPGRSRGRSLDATINLVPCIDLLSSLIAFLLMTAVWTQLGTLTAAAGGTGPSEGSPPAELELRVSRENFGLRWNGARREARDLKGLRVELEELRAGMPHAAPVRVLPDDEVPYELLVGAMDACAAAGLPQVTVASP
ncbi:MAG: biopolymer transporter ExbD [Myxococcota bacterium]